MAREYWQQPGGDGSVWNTPFGTGATFNMDPNDPAVQDLRHGGIINPPDYFGTPLWVGSASDPLRTYTLPDGSTVQIHVPANAFAGGGNTQTDNSMVLMDPVSHYGQIFVTDHGTDRIVEVEDALSNSFGEDQETGLGGQDEAAGMIREYDLDQIRAGGHMQHVLRYATDSAFLKNVAIDGVFKLGPNSWPDQYEDWQSGINVYTGNLPAGATIGIPMGEPMPAGLTQGGQELWWTLQHYGAIFRDQAGGGVHFATDQDAAADPLTDEMRQDLPQIVQHLGIMTNQHVGGQSFDTSPKQGPGARVDSGPPPLANGEPVPVPSGGDTDPPAATAVLAPGDGHTFTDSAGHVYSLAADGRATEDGQNIPGGAGTGAMALANGQIYGQDARSGGWYTWDQHTWTSAAAPSLPPAGGTSEPPPVEPPPADTPTVLTPTSGGELVDANGNHWTLTADGRVAENGQDVPGGAGTAQFAIVDGKYYGQDAKSGGWYTFDPKAGQWSSTSAPDLSGGATVTPDQLSLALSEDAWNGHAVAAVFLDGTKLGDATVTAAHGGQPDLFTWSDVWGAGPHDLAIEFTNDAYGGSPAQDRNLYIEQAKWNGAALMPAGQEQPLYWNGTVHIPISQG